jgi:hypothetical protein
MFMGGKGRGEIREQGLEIRELGTRYAGIIAGMKKTLPSDL